MKIQETLQIGLQVGGSFLACGICATLADRIAVNFFKKGVPYCLFRGMSLGKIGLELLKKGTPYYIYNAILVISGGVSVVIMLIACEKLKIERNERADCISVLATLPLFLTMVTLLAPPITKRFTKDSIGYVQSARHGLEAIVLLFGFIGLIGEKPQSIEESVKEKSAV